MSRRDDINDRYFEWMYDLICGERYSSEISYRKLLMQLHSTEFRFSIPLDENRAKDGISLRRTFALCQDQRDLSLYLEGPCSVLEMMLALSIRMESIASDPDIGDRTGQWFWGMIVNLGLGSMTDGRYDKQLVENELEAFLNRDYLPNGKGGLFTVRNTNADLRDLEIWTQMNWYLDDILEV